MFVSFETTPIFNSCSLDLTEISCDVTKYKINVILEFKGENCATYYSLLKGGVQFLKFLGNCVKYICLTSAKCAKTKGENEISCLISTLCVNRLSVIPEYSRFIDYSIIWMSMWCGLPQKLHKIELLNSQVSFKL